MFNISKIRPKFLFGPVKAQKFSQCLGLAQDCSNSSALAVELLQSCAKSLISLNAFSWKVISYDTEYLSQYQFMFMDVKKHISMQIILILIIKCISKLYLQNYSHFHIELTLLILTLLPLYWLWMTARSLSSIGTDLRPCTTCISEQIFPWIYSLSKKGSA